MKNQLWFASLIFVIFSVVFLMLGNTNIFLPSALMALMFIILAATEPE